MKQPVAEPNNTNFQ